MFARWTRQQLAVVRILLGMALCLGTGACSPRTVPMPQTTPPSRLKVLAVENYLADMAQNVAGERTRVDALLPIGADPHSFQPTPGDMRKVADCNVLIANGAGLEEFLNELLQNAGGQHLVIEAAAGLTSRAPRADEAAQGGSGGAREHEHEGDPHFWLDPNNAVKYVENIRDGLSHADPEEAAGYAARAQAYIVTLRELDQWVRTQMQQVPQSQRLLVTNHESLGYYADRYGLTIVGTVVPSVSSLASPSAQQVTRLVTDMQQLGVRAIFLETGNNPQLARQIAQETGISVVTELYTHSITAADGPAPTYVDMIRYDTQAIVTALR